MMERGRAVPSSIPSRLDMEPAATLRTTTSSGMISTSLISCSRMFRRRTKWVGTPMPGQLGHQIFADAVVEDALALDRVLLGAIAGGGVVLEILDDGARLGAFVKDLGLAFVDDAAALHGDILAGAVRPQFRDRGPPAQRSQGRSARIAGSRPQPRENGIWNSGLLAEHALERSCPPAQVVAEVEHGFELCGRQSALDTSGSAFSRSSRLPSPFQARMAFFCTRR